MPKINACLTGIIQVSIKAHQLYLDQERHGSGPVLKPFQHI